LINNRSTKIKDSIFEGIASNFEKAMNIEFASNVIAGQIKTAFDDKPGMDFNSGISVRPGLLILKNENDLKILKMKTSGLEITESNSLLENDEIVILRNQFLNLIEGVVGGVFTSYTASEMSERIRSGFKIRVPIFKIQDNFFNTISDHSIYLSGRFEQSLIEYNAFYRSQSVVIKITGINEIDEALVPHKSASESMNQGMYPGAVSSHVIRNTFAWTPNMALTLSGLGNRISENIILRYHSECEKREQLYKPIDPILGIYPHFLLYTLLSGDSRSGYAQSNLILNNKMIDDFSLLDDSWANSLLKSTILQAHICNNPVSNGVEDTERLIAVVYQHPGSKKTAYSNIFSGKGQEGFLWFSAGISPAPFTHAMRTVQKSGKNCPEDPSLVFENCTPLFAFQRKSSNGIPLRLGFLSEESPNGDDQYTRDVKKLEIRNRSDIIE
jgi:hypothetical protein